MVARLAAALPDLLCSQRERLIDTAVDWVPTSADAFYLEWDLSQPEVSATDLDLLYRVGWADRAPVTEKVQLAPLLARCTRWREDSALAAECSPYIWFELDRVRELPRSRPLPGVSVCLWRGFGRSVRDSRALCRDELPRLYEELCALYEAPFIAPQVAQRCARELPSSGALLHASAMGGRSRRRHKLYLVLPRDELSPMLARVGWRGSFHRLRQVMAALQADSTQVRVDLAFDEQLHPYVGLEFFSPRVPPDDPERRVLLDGCAALGLVHARQRAALCTWNGREHVSLRADAWPTRIDRWFDLKVEIYEEQVRLKAYLGARVGSRLF